LLLPLFLVFAAVAPAGEVKIAWYGQSMFEIVTPKGTRIVTDPHNLEAYRIKPMKADLVLMSHFHTDHTRTEVIENIKEAKQHNALKKTGAGGLNVEWNVVDEKFKDVRIQSMGTYHDAMSGLQRGKNGVWIIDVDGLRIVHLGDLGHPLNKTQLKKLGTVDVLMVPVGGVYTINGLEAFKVCEQVKPRRYILPMHYGTVVFDDLLPLKYFTDECKENEVPVVTYKPREWLRIDTKSALPKKASVAVLHYSGGAPIVKKKPKK
jgi:L-ascorbate metabolism protein UlaG (beta-lactamase superfamily)